MKYTTVDYLVGTIDPKTKNNSTPKFWVEYESTKKENALNYLKKSKKKLSIIKKTVKTVFETL